ncbi:RNA-binding cell elongation regulator Jag/EloR [Bacillus fonticola]|uniref:RNA-binding cell elongation regulator Jag/EloR n=1 Tax=Bacillus fonticola TaxID=2728853 RepID=UPI001473B9E1|nr:RNA-binding cell elongation regulator Jag/EloR [Bacillus fonticola]
MTYTATGQTVEEAVMTACKELSTTRDRVYVEIIEEGKKGFLGFGAKPAVVKVKKVVQPLEVVEQYVKDVLHHMGLTSAEVSVKQEGKDIFVSCETEEAGLLIGKRGATLSALQHIVQLVASQASEEYVSVQLDSGGYLEKRKETLQQLARRTADRVQQSGRAIKLEPMSAAERKIIHTALIGNKGISTTSQGNEPRRSVVISLTK